MDENENNGNWYDTLPENLRGEASITRYDSLEKFAGAKLELERKVGANTVVIPSEDANEDQINAFYTKLGRPEDKASYKFNIPEGVKVSEKEIEAFKDDAFKAGLSPKRANQIFESLVTRQSTNLSAEQTEAARVKQERLEEEKTKLLAEWGPSNYDRNMLEVEKALATFGDEGLKSVLEEAGLKDHPKIANMLFKASRAISDSDLPGEFAKPGRTITDIEEELSEMRTNPDSDYRKGKKHAIEKYTKLNQELFAGRQYNKKAS